MGTSPRPFVLGADADPRAARLALLLDAGRVGGGRALLRARPEIVLACVPVEGLARVAWLTTLVGAAAVIAVPTGVPAPLPPWGRRFHRFLLGSQGDALAWGAVGVALGRLVVVEPGPGERDGLASVLHEVRAMALRPDIRGRAR